MIGSFTLMNENGYANAFNYNRSIATNPLQTGFNTIIIMRYLTDYALNTRQAIRLLQLTTRGCSYFITHYDNSLTAVSEIYANSIDLTNPTKMVDPIVKKLIPNDNLLLKNSPPIVNNVITRYSDYDIDTELFTNINNKLLKYKKINEPLNQILSSWQEENYYNKTLGTYYYIMPKVLGKGRILQTNNPLTPIGRTTQMNDKTFELNKNAESINWRYDTLSKLIPLVKSSDIKQTMLLPYYISPYYNPDYLSNINYKNKIPPEKIPVQCCIGIYNSYERSVYIKAGPWQNPWIKLSFSSIFQK